MTHAILAADVSGWTQLSIVGTIVLGLIGLFLTLKAQQAKTRIDTIQLRFAETDQTVKHLKDDNESARLELTRTRADNQVCQDSIKQLIERADRADAARAAENRRCDEKLRRLGHIVKQLGGEVPDELNGLDD